MTECLYRDDAYLRQCDAEVTARTEAGVILDKTVFYALGGGQPGDTGVLRNAAGETVAVTDTRRNDQGDVVHQIAQDAAMAMGERVTAELDWARRYEHMRMHTALHLLGSLLPFPVTGGNISAVKSRLDFDMTDTVDKEQLTEQLNKLIQRDLAVSSQWITEAELDAQPDLVRTLSVKPPRGAGRIRLLKIETCDLQPCGGTHVAQTAEIGPMRVSKVEKKGRQNRRVNIVFG